jgi:hypothetical protein
LANQKIYTEEELKKFEEDYAKQQGWGQAAHPDQVAQQAQQHQPPPPPPVPVASQPHETQQHVTLPPVAPHADVVEKVVKPVDPSYGI